MQGETDTMMANSRGVTPHSFNVVIKRDTDAAEKRASGASTRVRTSKEAVAHSGTRSATRSRNSDLSDLITPGEAIGYNTMKPARKSKPNSSATSSYNVPRAKNMGEYLPDYVQIDL